MLITFAVSSDCKNWTLRTLLAHSMRSLLVVNLGRRVTGDGDPKPALIKAKNRVDRHFKVVVLIFLVDQNVVRIDLANAPEQRSVECTDRRPNWDIANAVRIVSHLFPSLVQCCSVVTLTPYHDRRKAARPIFRASAPVALNGCLFGYRADLPDRLDEPAFVDEPEHDIK